MEIELYDWFKIWVFFMVPVVGLVTLIQISNPDALREKFKSWMFLMGVFNGVFLVSFLFTIFLLWWINW